MTARLKFVVYLTPFIMRKSRYHSTSQGKFLKFEDGSSSPATDCGRDMGWRSPHLDLDLAEAISEPCRSCFR